MIFNVSSCLCCSLSLGTKLIGCFTIFLSAIATIVFGTSALIGSIAETRFVFYTCMATLAAIHFILSCLLVYATYKHVMLAYLLNMPSLFKECPDKMRLWSLYTSTISALIMGIGLTGIIIKIYLSSVNSTSSGDEEIVASVYFVIGAMMFYFASVVDSHRRKILLSRKRSNDTNEYLVPEDFPEEQLNSLSK